MFAGQEYPVSIPSGSNSPGIQRHPLFCRKGHSQASASAWCCHMLMINYCSQLIKALLNLALTQRNPQQMPSFRRAPGGQVAGSVFKVDQVSSVSVVFLTLFKQEGLNDKIKNFSENHLYSHPALELDSLYSSSAEGHGLPSSICKALTGSTAFLLHIRVAISSTSGTQGAEKGLYLLFPSCPFAAQLHLLFSTCLGRIVPDLSLACLLFLARLVV